jgi:hypothetical protein
VKAKVTVATGKQSGLGHLFSVDALNMLERFDAGSGGFRKICAAELLLAAQLSRHER